MFPEQSGSINLSFHMTKPEFPEPAPDSPPDKGPGQIPETPPGGPDEMPETNIPEAPSIPDDPGHAATDCLI